MKFFIIQANKFVGVYHESKCPSFSYAPASKFKDFIKSIKEAYPQATFSLNRDKEMTAKLEKKIKFDLMALQNQKNRT